MIHGPGLGFARCRIWNCIIGIGVKCIPMDSVVLVFFRYWQHFWRAALGRAFGYGVGLHCRCLPFVVCLLVYAFVKVAILLNAIS